LDKMDPGKKSADLLIASYIQGIASRVDKPTNVSSIVATLRGSSEPDRIVVIRLVFTPSMSRNKLTWKSQVGITIRGLLM